MSDRLQEIRARLDAMPTDRPWHVVEVSALIPHVPADIEYLLALVQEQAEHLRAISADLADA